MKTLTESASRATAPWRSLDAGRSAYPDFERLPQQEIDVCLACRYSAKYCDTCDGAKKDRGRPRIEIDALRLKEMLKLRRCNTEMCAALGVSEKTLIKAKNKIYEEELHESNE